MDHNIQRANPDDIFLWPDDANPAGATRCYRSEYERGHYQQMSDDFRVIPAGCEEWQRIEGQTA